MSLCNAYPESFKINVVKRYLNGEMQKDLCKEFNLAKSTLWGWCCKYQPLINKERELKEDVLVSENNDYVDIRLACNEALKSSVIQESKNIIRIFLDGFVVICNIENLKFVMEVIKHG